MVQWQLELCQRHLQRLYTRLRGRGARKARELVRRLHDAIDRCCRDITGSRSEVHALLVEMLGTELAGGDRNIRDCLDLLARESPLFSKDGHRCSILLAQLHDPHSELIRQIAEEEASAAQGSTVKASPPPNPPSPPEPPEPPEPPSRPPEAGDPRAATTATATTPPRANTTPMPQPMPLPTPTPTPMPLPTTPPMLPTAASPTPTPTSTPTPPAPPSSQPSPAPSTEQPWVTGLGPYRVLGADDRSSATTPSSAPRATVPTAIPMPGPPGISSAFTPSPTAPIAGLLHDDPDDPYDPELESLDAPSRWRLASRQKPPTPGDGGGTQGSS